MSQVPPPVGPDWKLWARQVSAYLSRAIPNLIWKTAAHTPATNGVILWDEANKYPVVSKDGVWTQIVLEDGNYLGQITSNVTAAASNTAYSLTFTSAIAAGIANDGTYPSRLVFAEAGEYVISFSAQIASTASALLNFWFWPRVNGVDVTGSTMKNSLASNGQTLVVSRTAIFTMAAGDYLEAMWATDDYTKASLAANAATAFCPATPAATITISRMHG